MSVMTAACTYDYDAFQTPTLEPPTTSGNTGATGGTGNTGPGGAGADGAGGTGGAGGAACENRALAFDGIDDLVHISGNNVFDALPSFTVEAWISPVSRAFQTSEWHIVSDHVHAENLGWALLINNGVLEFRIYNNGSLLAATGTIEMDPGTWHHVAGTFDAEIATALFDGQVVGMLDTFEAAPGVNSGPTRIGAAAYEENFFFAGLIDEVRISRIAQYAGAYVIPDAPFPDTDPDTLSLFHFDEEQGQAVTDAKTQVVARLGLTGDVEDADPTRVVAPCIEDLQ